MAIDSFQGPNRFLSNFYYCTITFEGRVYDTVEAAYQAAKSLDPLTRAAIAHAETPGEAKRMGSKITLRPDWEQIKPYVMLSLLMKKFSDPVLQKMLLETGDEELIEGNNWGDTYWGVCNGKGKNNLGKLLMDVRDFYRRLKDKK